MKKETTRPVSPDTSKPDSAPEQDKKNDKQEAQSNGEKFKALVKKFAPLAIILAIIVVALAVLILKGTADNGTPAAMNMQSQEEVRAEYESKKAENESKYVHSKHDTPDNVNDAATYHKWLSQVSAKKAEIMKELSEVNKTVVNYGGLMRAAQSFGDTELYEQYKAIYDAAVSRQEVLNEAYDNLMNPDSEYYLEYTPEE